MPVRLGRYLAHTIKNSYMYRLHLQRIFFTQQQHTHLKGILLVLNLILCLFNFLFNIKLSC